MNKLVMRRGLGALLVLAALPITARAQTAPPPTPAATPAPVAPAPLVPAASAPVPELAPAPEAPPPVAQPVEPAPTPLVAVEAPAPAAPAPDAPTLPTITGYVEAGYNVHFSDPDVNNAVPLRVYDAPGHSFSLHAAHLAVTHKFSDAISAVIEIDAGRDAAATSGGVGYPFKITPQFAFDVQEAYANYAASGWTLTAGKFVTYEGIEVIEGPLNPTITRGYLFGFAEPFTHTGAKMHYQPVDEFNIGLGVVNGWDLIADNNSMKTIIARAAYTPSTKFFAALSGSFGSEQPHNSTNHRVSIDLTGAITPSASFQLWYQGNYGMEKHALLSMGTGATAMLSPISGTATWWGVGLQPVITAGDFTLGSRLEFFSDPQGVRAGLGPHGKFFNVTITPGIKLASTFKLRAELRADIASDKVLGKASDPSTTQFSGALSAEYMF
jgi:hypothetical protein